LNQCARGRSGRHRPRTWLSDVGPLNCHFKKFLLPFVIRVNPCSSVAKSEWLFESIKAIQPRKALNGTESEDAGRTVAASLLGGLCSGRRRRLMPARSVSGEIFRAYPERPCVVPGPADSPHGTRQGGSAGASHWGDEKLRLPRRTDHAGIVAQRTSVKDPPPQPSPTRRWYLQMSRDSCPINLPGESAGCAGPPPPPAAAPPPQGGRAFFRVSTLV
jgi:hypothetical protein